MQNIDVKVFTLITVATATLVWALKKAFPKLVNDKEEIWSVLLPVLFVVGAKLGNLFKGTDWTDALLWAFGSGVGAGIAHDYAAKPGASMVKGLMSFIFKGKETPPNGDAKS